jgi:hypothetical protein
VPSPVGSTSDGGRRDWAGWQRFYAAGRSWRFNCIVLAKNDLALQLNSVRRGRIDEIGLFSSAFSFFRHRPAAANCSAGAQERCN